MIAQIPPPPTAATLPAPPPCVLFHCGAVMHPNVWLVYVNRPADDRITEGARAIVEDGYLDANPSVGSGHLAGVQSISIPPHQFGFLQYLAEPDFRPRVVNAPGSVTLFVLPEDIRSAPPDAECDGCLVTSSYHAVTVTPGVAYAVVQGFDRTAFANAHAGYPRSQPQQLFDVAHEIEEASADQENEDACGTATATWGPYQLPSYRIGDACTFGSYSKHAATPDAGGASSQTSDDSSQGS